MDQQQAKTFDKQAQWRIATEVLHALLGSNGGIVSSKQLCPELTKRGVEDAQEMNKTLKLYNFDDPEPELPKPSFRYHHRGRSFYSPERFSEVESQIETEAKEAEQRVKSEQVPATDGDEQEETVSSKKKRRQEEARMGKYIEEALEDLYASDYMDAEADKIAFDIHNERSGAEFENVDLIAVHWRKGGVVELIAVEAKLEFSPKLVLQARNYKRFAHRVWIAVPVSSDKPHDELREEDERLFEHVVENGIGILACRKGRGRSYQVFPIHWPSLNQLDSVGKAEFVDRYRRQFELARVAEPKQVSNRPRIR